MRTKFAILAAIIVGGVLAQPTLAEDTGGEEDDVCIDAEDGFDCQPMDIWIAECRLLFGDDPVPDSSPCFEVDFYGVPEDALQLTNVVPPHEPQPPRTLNIPRPLLKGISVPLPPPSVGPNRVPAPTRR